MKNGHLPLAFGLVGAALVIAIFVVSGSPDRLAPALLDANQSPFVDGPEPPGWVARVGDRYLTRETLARVVVPRVRADLVEPGSGPSAILRQLVQERVVVQEARRLGIEVTDEEVQGQFHALNGRVARIRPGWNLLDVIEGEQGITVAEFLQNLRHMLLKAKIAGHFDQVEGVIGELLRNAEIQGVDGGATLPDAQDLANGVIATVNGSPITQEELGAQLVLRLPRSRIKEIIQEECRAELAREWMLSRDEMQAIIAIEEERWLQRREMTAQEVLRSVSYKDWVELQYRLDLEGLRCSRYFRCLYGMVEAQCQETTDDEVRLEYEEKSDTVYGDRFLVTDIQIAFAPSEDQQGPSGGRTCEEAHALARGMLSHLSSGWSFDELVRDREAARDGTQFSRRLRVRRSGSTKLLYENAKQMRDGEVSQSIEGPDAVHIIRREGWIAAPAFEDAEDLIRHRLAFERVHAWFEERMADPDLVEIRWPASGAR